MSLHNAKSNADTFIDCIEERTPDMTERLHVLGTIIAALSRLPDADLLGLSTNLLNFTAICEAYDSLHLELEEEQC